MAQIVPIARETESCHRYRYFCNAQFPSSNSWRVVHTYYYINRSDSNRDVRPTFYTVITMITGVIESFISLMEYNCRVHGEPRSAIFRYIVVYRMWSRAGFVVRCVILRRYQREPCISDTRRSVGFAKRCKRDTEQSTGATRRRLLTAQALSAKSLRIISLSRQKRLNIILNIASCWCSGAAIDPLLYIWDDRCQGELCL